MSDPEFDEFSVSCYEYPTALIRLPFARRMPTLIQLADGLRTVVKARYGQGSSVILVGHSLGGLVCRQYLVNELKVGRTPPVEGLLLYASPNTGAALASLGSLLSFRHPHMRQLQLDEDLVRVLNDDWEILKTEERIKVHYVAGGADQIVTPASAHPFFGRSNNSVLIGHDHRSIIKPLTINDIRYLTLRNFIFENTLDTNVALRASTHIHNSDPLFDIYYPEHEPYYVARQIDQSLESAMASGHIWLSAPSGVGKTAALRRCASVRGWQVDQLMLSAYEDTTAKGLLRAICTELGGIAEEGDGGVCGASDLPSLISAFKRYTVSAGAAPKSILIEEIPVASPEQFGAFLEIVQTLTLALDNDPATKGRVMLAFSSIVNPTAYIRDSSQKLRERIRFIRTDWWSEADVLRLTRVLSSVLRPDLTEDEIGSIASSATGSPRFVKMLFRHWKYGTDGSLSLSKLLKQVSSENIR